MADKSPSLTETRSTLRQVVAWADAVHRLKDVLDAGAAFELSVEEYGSKTAELAKQYEAAVKQQEQDLDYFKKKCDGEARSMEKERAANVALRAQFDVDNASMKTAYDAAKQELVTRHADLAATLRAEHTKLSQEVAQMRVAHKAETDKSQQERLTSQHELQTLRDERHRILQQFASA
jgi:hypothetical protein